MTLNFPATGPLRTVSAAALAVLLLAISGPAKAETETAQEYRIRANREVQAMNENAKLVCLKAKAFEATLEKDRPALEDGALKTRREEVEALNAGCDRLTAEYEARRQELQAEYEKRYGAE
ncbi:hypothetical protein GGD81_004155 [Rhodobium orientis]|uniref:Uncharacterized protein n=1 Tax=Rhodobium orientis TaxID=34017 RepID=A0A327JQF4_9HYPH|nr:hypothetical protein [Rhodobium orientis]MBB4305087.1 hypothetical protein [Rhodobium orientis]MBK5952155.1 hypothetical protein [Rhodobium orientis]RAI25628.1 hypothetical protein CH339_17265 [Rhodobium orientis]